MLIIFLFSVIIKRLNGAVMLCFISRLIFRTLSVRTVQNVAQAPQKLRYACQGHRPVIVVATHRSALACNTTKTVGGGFSFLCVCCKSMSGQSSAVPSVLPGLLFSLLKLQLARVEANLVPQAALKASVTPAFAFSRL